MRFHLRNLLDASRGRVATVLIVETTVDAITFGRGSIRYARPRLSAKARIDLVPEILFRLEGRALRTHEAKPLSGRRADAGLIDRGALAPNHTTSWLVTLRAGGP